MAKDISEITKKLESGVIDTFTSEKYTDYLNFVSKFYQYSANNCMLIMMQCPGATHVAGYRKWQNDFHRQVRKGEKSIKILAPIPHRMRKEVTNSDGSKEEKDINWTTFRTVSVFDISQTDGEEVPTLVDELDGMVNDFEDLKDRLVKVAPVPVVFNDIEGEAKGYYSSRQNVIVVQDGMSEVQTIKTMVHEIAHSILHSPEGEEKEANRRKREVQAESVAYVVCNSLNLDTSDYSFTYVASWSSGKEVKELMESLETIRKTSATILDKLAA